MLIVRPDPRILIFYHVTARGIAGKYFYNDIGQESIWRYLNRQVFLGDDYYVQQMQHKAKRLAEEFNIPKTQRHSPALSLKR
jgi:hypothetical protein